MGKQFYLFFLSLFFISCSQDVFEEKFEDLENTEIVEMMINPPPTCQTCLDSLLSALNHVVTLMDMSTSINGYSIFQMNYSTDDDAIVRVEIGSKPPYRFWVSRNLIRRYSWRGYLLIALHEWFHIRYRRSNEEAHSLMAYDIEFWRYLAEAVGCDLTTARWLAFSGMENTEVYESLSAEDKAKVRQAEAECRIYKNQEQ